MMKIRKNVLFCIVVLLVGFFVVLLDNKTYMINTFDGNTIYLEDLKVGDFIENGAVLNVTGNYHLASGSSKVVLYCFSEDVDSTCDYSDWRTLTTYGYTVPSYDKIFGGTINHSGWTYKDVVYYNQSYYLLFVPADEMSTINKFPSFENEYEVESKCVSGDNVKYNWYKTVDITDYSVTSNSNKDFELNYNDDIFLLERSNLNKNSEIVITFEFDATEGGYCFF